MVYVVWYNNSRRIFYDITQLRQFLKTVPLNSVKIFERDNFGNMNPIEPASLFVGRNFNRPVPDVVINENVRVNEPPQNREEFRNRFNSIPEQEVLKNSLNEIRTPKWNVRRTFSAFIIKIVLVIFAVIAAYFLLPLLLNAIFS